MLCENIVKISAESWFRTKAKRNRICMGLFHLVSVYKGMDVATFPGGEEKTYFPGVEVHRNVTFQGLFKLYFE